jgi:hypothetical protein
MWFVKDFVDKHGRIASHHRVRFYVSGHYTSSADYGTFAYCHSFENYSVKSNPHSILNYYGGGPNIEPIDVRKATRRAICPIKMVDNLPPLTPVKRMGIVIVDSNPPSHRHIVSDANVLARNDRSACAYINALPDVYLPLTGFK